MRKRPPTKLCHCQRQLGGGGGAAWVVRVYELFLIGEGVGRHSGVLSPTGLHSIDMIKWPDYCHWSVLFVKCRSGVCVCFNVSVKCECGLISQRTLAWEESNCADWETDCNTRVAGGVNRHQQHRQRPRQSAGEAAGVNRRQRTKTSPLVRRHFNAHICSSANLTRISKVKIPNSNINFEVRKFEVSLTSLLLLLNQQSSNFNNS